MVKKRPLVPAKGQAVDNRTTFFTGAELLDHQLKIFQFGDCSGSGALAVDVEFESFDIFRGGEAFAVKFADLESSGHGDGELFPIIGQTGVVNHAVVVAVTGMQTNRRTGGQIELHGIRQSDQNRTVGSGFQFPELLTAGDIFIGDVGHVAFDFESDLIAGNGAPDFGILGFNRDDPVTFLASLASVP